MITKRASKLVYLACLFVSLAASITAQAQTYTLSDGQPLIYGGTGPSLAALNEVNNILLLYPSLVPTGSTYTQSQYLSQGITLTTGTDGTYRGATGGAGGVVNLMTSGYDAVQMTSAGYQNYGTVYVMALTPSQVASNTLLYAQSYTVNAMTSRTWASTYNKGNYSGKFTEPPSWVPSTGIAYPTLPQKAGQDYFDGNTFATTTSTPMAVYAGQNNIAAWYAAGVLANTPGAGWTAMGTATITSSIALIWSNGQLHLTNNSADTIVPIPAGWAGAVAIVCVNSGPATNAENWNIGVSYLTAQVGTPQPPQGTISTSATQIQANGKINVSWQLQ